MPKLVLRGLRTLSELFAGGAARVVNRLMDQGVYGERLFQRMQRLFPDALTASLRALRERVLNQRDLAMRVNRGYRVTRRDCRSAVQTPNITGPVEYTGTVRFLDPDSGQPTVRVVSVPLDFGASFEDIKRALIEKVRTQRARPSRRDTLPGGQLPESLTDFEVRITRVECAEF